MCTTCMAMRPYEKLCLYRDILSNGTEGTELVEAGSSGFWTADQAANYIANDFWGAGPLAFNVSSGGTLLVNLSGLNATGRTLAEAALDTWSDVTGIQFSETTGTAHITFDDNNPGAYAQLTYTGAGTLLSSFVNVSTAWVGGNDSIDSYGFQTYLHEIGHALGLGHAGDYNGGASYGSDNLYANDSWQMSVMSYFSQTENTAINASFAFVITPMLADILAIQSLYGVGTARADDTVYGYGSTAGASLDAWVTSLNPVAVTLVDTGGWDVLDLGQWAGGQRIDLAPEAISDVLGLVGNLVIARNTIIEEARTGDGDDHVTGNDAANLMVLGAGSDTAFGGEGNDTILGGTAEDMLYGDAGNDRLESNAGFDTIFGGDGDDTILGGAQADTLYGDDGDDVIEAEEGRDRAWGGAGNDLLTGGEGEDMLFGGTEADTLLGGAADDRLWGEAGFDLLRGGAGDDELWGGAQADNLYGDDGLDTLWGEAGLDRLFGGDGNDTAHGGDGDDALFGEAGDDNLNGNTGADRLFGGSGHDMLAGGDGTDVLDAGAGFDVIDGGDGNDILAARFNADTFVFATGHGSDVITDFDAANPFEKIDLSGVAAITDFSDLTSDHLSQDGADAVITGVGGDVIRLASVTTSDLDETDFLF